MYVTTLHGFYMNQDNSWNTSQTSNRVLYFLSIYVFRHLFIGECFVNFKGKMFGLSTVQVKDVWVENVGVCKTKGGLFVFDLVVSLT